MNLSLPTCIVSSMFVRCICTQQRKGKAPTRCCAQAALFYMNYSQCCKGAERTSHWPAVTRQPNPLNTIYLEFVKITMDKQSLQGSKEAGLEKRTKR